MHCTFTLFYNIRLLSDYLADAIESGYSYDWPGGLGVSGALESCVRTAMHAAFEARAVTAPEASDLTVSSEGASNESFDSAQISPFRRLTVREVREFMTTDIAEYWEVRFVMLHAERTEDIFHPAGCL